MVCRTFPTSSVRGQFTSLRLGRQGPPPEAGPCVVEYRSVCMGLRDVWCDGDGGGGSSGGGVVVLRGQDIWA